MNRPLMLFAVLATPIAADAQDNPLRSERILVAMGDKGPLDAVLDADVLLSPPPVPHASTGRLAQLPGFQWLDGMLPSPAAMFDGTVIEELLMSEEPLNHGVWPAPETAHPANHSRGGFLGIRGALDIAAQGQRQFLPTGVIFRPYLAGPKESRLATHLVHEQDDGWLFDHTLGGRIGLVRWGTADPVFPQGVQIDLEGSAQLRIDSDEDLDLRSTDFRAGVPLTFGHGRHRTKLAYYHISSHLGDEFLIKTGMARVNYSRDVLVLAHAIYLWPTLRMYAEAGWGFYMDVSEPWEFQFGADYAPARGCGGAPFLAINGVLREEVDFSGSLSVQAGWAWRSHQNARLLRIGAHYVNGLSTQYSFFTQHEQLVGLGVWID